MTNSPLTIAALPLNITWADPDANLTAVESAARNLRPETDILVLPELFSTGFVADPDVFSRLAETDSDNSMTRIRAIAECHRIAVAGSFLACNDARNEFYNRGFLVQPGGEEIFVNKRHLFHVSPEANLLTQGLTPYPVARFRGWNIALGVCYDLRFPVWCRNTMCRGRYAYDIFLLPANWPQSRAFALEALNCARAIENQAYFVAANRSGSDEYGDYDGLTFIDDYIGQRVASSNPLAPAEPVYATADREGLKKLRDYMPAGLDSDTFSINY